MTTRQVKDGRAVTIAEPVQVAARFNRPDLGGIVGAGGCVLPRWLLDAPGVVAMHADARRRVCIAWPEASINGELIAGGAASMWLDADLLEVMPAAKPIRPPAVPFVDVQREYQAGQLPVTLSRVVRVF